ncbi:MAG TPA: sigma-70 family RNA polymerase sigma factor [Verrucomicrobiae bacterium]|jgi:RNA polymerase sigma-70 factor (ECF subfamily)|nr:sigma-70 family RNA polymerase sigma factor [Verrucomicrobiae bacterium]
MAGDRPPADDAALVRDVAAGSQSALGDLYDRYVDAVFAAASRLTADRQVAEEVVQETFLALWNRAELFDPAVGSLAAWLHTIARNRTVDRLRAAGRRPNLIPLSSAAGEDEQAGAALDRLVAAGTVIGGAGTGPGPEGELAATELRHVLREALAELPDAERTAIVLAYREDLTQTEIAERLGWPLGTVKTRTRRALLRLRGALAEELGPGAAPMPIPVPIHDRMER